MTDGERATRGRKPGVGLIAAHGADGFGTCRSPVIQRGTRIVPSGLDGPSSLSWLTRITLGGRPLVDAWTGVRLTTIPALRTKMAKTPPTLPSSPTPANYEEALAELEALVAAMEGGQLPLDALLQNYRRGADLLKYCRERLDAVEQQVKVLEEGQLKPWKNE
jgi:exodeoxyribonuclease VII small subunit